MSLLRRGDIKKIDRIAKTMNIKGSELAANAGKTVGSRIDDVNSAQKAINKRMRNLSPFKGKPRKIKPYAKNLLNRDKHDEYVYKFVQEVRSTPKELAKYDTMKYQLKTDAKALYKNLKEVDEKWDFDWESGVKLNKLTGEVDTIF